MDYVHYKRLEDLEDVVKGFLGSYGVGAVLIISPAGKKIPFVQFAKRKDGQSEVLLFGIPDAPWSREYFERMENKLATENFRITSTGEPVVRRFLEVPVDASDAASAAAEAQHLIEKAFNALDISPESRFGTIIEGPLDLSSLRKTCDNIAKSDRANVLQKGAARILSYLSSAVERVVNLEPESSEKSNDSRDRSL